MRRKASTSFRGHPHSRLNLSPNPAFRLFDILAGPPDFGSRTISFRTSSDILASASSASSSDMRALAASASMCTAPFRGIMLALPAALRDHDETTAPDDTPSLRATADGPMPLRSSDSASRLVASG